MVGQYKEQLSNLQKSVTKFMMSMPVALGVVALACLSMVQFQQQIQVYLHQYLPLVAVVFAVFIGVQNYQYKQLFKELIESVGKIEVTSQVVATRANMTEWRSCLQFNADWSQYSLQTAYRMWQLGLLRSPPPPANTVNGNGMQLSTYDAVIADTVPAVHADLSHVRLLLLSVEGEVDSPVASPVGEPVGTSISAALEPVLTNPVA